MNFETVVCQLW